MFASYPSTLMGHFRIIAVMEGISYLALILVAMPLKYFAGIPDFVKYIGWAHGVLFVSFCIYLLRVWIKYEWSFGKSVFAFVTSLVPFGTFVLDKQLKREYARS